MKARPLTAVAALIALIALSGVPSAQEPTGTDTAPIRRVRVLVSLSGGADRENWLRGLSIALTRESLVSAALRAPSGADPYDEALRQDCALILEATAALSAGGVTVAWRLVDSLSREALAEGSYESPAPTARDLSGFFWDDIVAALPEVVPKVRYTAFLFRAPPGTVVSGFSRKPLTVPASGELEIAADAPSTYRWRARVPRAYPAGGTFAFLGLEGTTLEAPAEPLPAWSIDAGLIMGQFPELRADLRFAGDWAFAGVTITSFWPGIVLSGDGYWDAPAPWLVFLPLVEPGIRVGARFAPPDATFRPYGAIGAFARLMFPKGYFGLDPVAPWGLLPSLGLEYGPSRILRVWAELGADLYPPGTDAILLRASSGDRVGSLGGWLIAVPNIRFGVRWSP